MGMPNVKIGTITAVAVAYFCEPVTTMTESTYPRTRLPESPRKTFAGLKLKGRNPSNAPINTNKTVASSIAPVYMKIAAQVPAAMLPRPAAQPSKPSIRLNAFVMPTIQKMVRGIERIPSSRTWSPANATRSRCTPDHTAMPAAAHCARNLVLADSGEKSSQTPQTKMTAPPARIPPHGKRSAVLS